MRYELVYMRASITELRLYPVQANVMGFIGREVLEEYNEKAG